MSKVTIDIGGSKARVYCMENKGVESFEIFGGFGIAEDKNGVCKPLVRALKKEFGRGRYLSKASLSNRQAYQR